MWFKRAISHSSFAPNSSRTGVPSILGADLRIEGNVIAESEVHIAGSLTGNITTPKLTLSRGGSVSGVVEAETAEIHGNLAGRLAAVSVVLGRTARVTADIIYVSMRVEPGAVFEGYSRRIDQVEDANSERPSLPSPHAIGETAAAAE